MESEMVKIEELKEMIRETIERELIVEAEDVDIPRVELEAEEILVQTFKDGDEERLYHFDEKYDANITSLYYIIQDSMKKDEVKG